MRKHLFWAVAALVCGCFAACVDSSSSSLDSPAGSSGGACFANGTCNPGLSCSAANNVCVASGSGSDASTPTGDGGTITPTNDSGGSTTDPNACAFTTSTYPCKAPTNPTTACFNSATVDCTASGCNPTDVTFTCYSVKQCTSLQHCCMPLASAAINVGATCAEGVMTIVDGGTVGGQCTSSACAGTDMELCQVTADCPTGLRCNQVKIAGDGGALSGVEIGVCVPE